MGAIVYRYSDDESTSKGADQYGSNNVIIFYEIINTKGQFQYGMLICKGVLNI